ncbi:iron-siderophore ABC transporter substrate-binding protein [Chlorogloeopsis sp. ULAP02]|uniref:ABC transporter substrate-binding protein n=1 Tax=Chlorogloeopsis sp. ULAP02 TaxID=3107926 RepID=UPI0031346F66
MGVLSKATPVKILQCRTTYLLFLEILVFSVVLACGRNVNYTAKYSEQSAPECRVVQHIAGETCVPNHPKRVVTIPFLTLAHAILLDIKPIGSTSSGYGLGYDLSEESTATYLSNQTFLGDKAAGIQDVGETYMPNLEKILELKPDLILSWQATQDIYPLLSQISPTVLAPWQGPPSWKENFSFVAKALGKEEAAQQAWDRYYQRIEELKIALGDQYQDKKISVINLGGGVILAHAKNSFSGFILDDIGLQRPELQNVVTPFGSILNISEERLQEIDGDVLFVLVFDSRDKNKLENLQRKPLWKKLKAVQQGQVYLVDSGAWAGNSLLAADAVIDDLYKYLVNTP